MTNFTIKNIPDDLYDALKRRAAENQRSINQEAIFCLRMELSRQKRTRADAEALLGRIDQQRRASEPDGRSRPQTAREAAPDTRP